MDAPGHKRDEPAADEEGETIPLRHRRLEDDPGREARWDAWRVENAGTIAAYTMWFEQKGHRYLRKPLF